VIIKANTERTDVDAVYNCGGQHGFGETITTSKRGEQNVYVYAINIGDGKNVCLGNKNVTITETGTPTLYQLQYDPGYGGSGSMEPETVAVGDKVILPECSFKAPLGKKFYKWQISGVDGIFDPGYEYTVVENSIMGNVITVTATWKEAPPATVTTAPTAKALICTGAEQELVNAGAASGGVMSYAIGNDSINAPTSGWNVKIPKKAAAGTYYVWYKAVGDVSHSDTEPKCVTVTIAKQNPKVVTEVTVNAATVNAKAIAKAIKKAGTTKAKVKTIVLGNKVRKIGKKAFKSYKKVKTLIVRTKKLKKSKVKGSLKGSKITKVKVQVGSKKVNKKFVKKYKKIFKKKNAGKKVKVTI
jgi:hypothetical protein